MYLKQKTLELDKKISMKKRTQLVIETKNSYLEQCKR